MLVYLSWRAVWDSRELHCFVLLTLSNYDVYCEHNSTPGLTEPLATCHVSRTKAYVFHSFNTGHHQPISLHCKGLPVWATFDLPHRLLTWWVACQVDMKCMRFPKATQCTNWSNFVVNRPLSSREYILTQNSFHNVWDWCCHLVKH
jgi:hypothetical protein